MIIHRDIFINPVDAEYLAFRFASGIDTQLRLAFKDQGGAPWKEDVVAQLQMVGRSHGRGEYYPCPATDVVNGEALATIPAGLAYDPNGWQVRLTATIDQEPRVLAYGVATAIAGAGIQVQPQDVIDTINLTFQRDEEVNLNVTLWADDGKSAPYDLTAMGTTLQAAVYDAQGGIVLVPFTLTPVSVNTVNLYLTPDQVNGLPDACWWSLTASTGVGTTTLCEGSVTVQGVVAPPFTPVTANYAYTKQDTLVPPATGAAIHSNYALDVLRIHQFDSDAVDRDATLSALVTGDLIGVGATLWSIASITKTGLDWYAVNIAPAEQATPVGITPFTFSRP